MFDRFILVRLMKKAITGATILLSTIKDRKVKLEIVHQPSSLPPVFEVEGRNVYVCSMLVAYLKKNQDLHDNFRSILIWHLRSRSSKVEKVESEFIENLTHISNNPWCVWWDKNTFNSNADFLVCESVWRSFCKDIMRKNLKC
jgi:hypothetical protein